jgi:hypothetical protein
MKEKVLWTIIMVSMSYYGVSMLAYSLAHREMTQTQILRNVGNALTWNW